MFSVLLAAKYESAVRIWLSRRNFEKNGMKQDKNDDFEGFHDVTQRQRNCLLNYVNITYDIMNFKLHGLYLAARNIYTAN